MNNDDLYMADFMRVFETLERWGPGGEFDTKKAISCLPKEPKNVLEIGCGKGLATRVLFEHTKAKITALDTEQIALDRLKKRFAHYQSLDRLQTVCASMSELPFSNESFDLIWAEGSAYIMGVEKALAEWKPVLANQGNLVISDMVWKTSTPCQESIEFWIREYPDIQSVETRIQQMQTAGYAIVAHFAQSQQAWLNYYEPLAKRVSELESEMPASHALNDIKNEVDVSMKFQSEFGYHVFVLEKQ